MKIIDNFLNRITAYRLTLYYLFFLVGFGFLISYTNRLPFNSVDIVINLVIAVSVCYFTNLIFAKLFKAATNVESVFITALILVLIVPVKFPLNAVFIVGASFFAIASKYLLTIEKRHIFNPAAAAVAAISLLSPEFSATWWIGTPLMFVPVLLGGLLLVRKMQREAMVMTFLLTYSLLIAGSSFLNLISISAIITTFRASFLQSAVLFFVFVMVTEPLTSPVNKRNQAYYGYLVALLYSTPFLRLGIDFTPEIALIFGNIFAYIVNPKYRLSLKLIHKAQVSLDSVVFAFNKPDKFKFTPGQYMEWTIPHKKPDNRGVRRYFSISSSPGENNIQLLVKFNNPSSSYKASLSNMQEGGEIIASSLSGDFVLPKDLSKPLVFIAGGVGIAPFRSMIKHIVDNNLSSNIILIYVNRDLGEILFKDIFDAASKNGVKTLYSLTNKENIPQNWQGLVGHIDENTIRQIIPDYKSSVYYISGPWAMVQSCEKALHLAGIKKSHIKIDFFPGYEE